jgi:hypothetical protein
VLDRRVIAHVQPRSPHSDPVPRLLERGEGERLAASLHTIAASLLGTPLGTPTP